MLAGAVKNRNVYVERETSHLKDPLGVGKCPFAILRAHYDPKNVILMVRDPAYIVTSNTHSDYQGYVFGWVEDESCAKKALKPHWEAMRRYLAPKRGRGAFLVRYEDLMEDPDGVQKDLGEAFGFEYKDRQFSNWPDGFGKLSDYWKASLGEMRPLVPRNSFNPETRARVSRISAQHPDFNECRQFLGYNGLPISRP